MSGEERLIASWECRPFTSVKRRGDVVEHRIVLDAYPGVGCDVRHEVQCPDYGVPEWTLAEAYEVRDHGIQKVESDDRWWSS